MTRQMQHARRASASGKSDRRGTQSLAFRDAAACIGAQARSAVAGAYEQAMRLQSIADQAAQTAGETHSAGSADELLQRAHQLRGIACHVSSIVLELTHEASRLEELARVRQVFELELAPE